MNKVALCFWSSFYDGIYENPDRPPEDVINDDCALDRWIEEYSSRMERETRAAFRKSGGGRSAWDHDEVIVFEDEDE